MLLSAIYSNDQINGHEMGWTCGTYGVYRRVCRVLVGKVKVRDHLADSGVDGKIASNCNINNSNGRVESGAVG
jgi:hypothetical protein